ncbi:NAD(P) transhydrogenase subunit alpha [Allorhizocola rhizosphaerae]|uniref:NAD(P) transhydrogenase subunit alpha n=1 Tax=Allorhizocola rhizosphaerae TaxID=1872709 RepID=UPI000E3DEC8D|nr:NAD(P) transhydrogenase subunit alpha [Allorhizocola rhizosphaerae]
MKVAVVRETRPQEKRVAVTPDAVGKLIKSGLVVRIEAGAGAAAGFGDESYRDAGAEVSATALDGAHVLLGVQPPSPEQVARLDPAALVISFLPIAQERKLLEVVRDSGRSALAMELIPRITRAQSMDALSSQALVAGYRCALIAAERLRRFFPMSMTAAGTIPPAKVLVLGAGVAGLQAIATARRLGAVVRAYDVRAAAAEEVRSVGAEFIDLQLPALDGAAGYAREMTEDRAGLQRELLAPHVADADALITTAAVPGRSAPLLVTKQMVAAMRPGSVVVDLAAEQGGNVEGAMPGAEVSIGGAVVVGGRNVPSQMAGQASRLYAANVSALLLLMTVEGDVVPDMSDEIVSGCCVVHKGEVRFAPARELLERET